MSVNNRKHVQKQANSILKVRVKCAEPAAILEIQWRKLVVSK
jgi:hypothetical protein